MHIGIAASRIYREAPAGELFALAREIFPSLLGPLGARISIVGQTYDALEAQGLIPAGAAVTRLPSRRKGGVIHLVAGVVERNVPSAIDAAFFLLDPDDPTSIFPEGLALKRECVIHSRPFVSTLAHAREWVELARVRCGLAPEPALNPWFDFSRQCIALVAHDARKSDMLAFVERHFDLLDSFSRRIATGTTGRLLNELAAARGRKDWAEPYQSGPRGGDAQIAREVLEERCQRILFFEDAHVAREHEADIQLLERSARIRSEQTMCLSDPLTAERWAVAIKQRIAATQDARNS
ncbi:MAG: methylglyoxal synthase [Burkholderiaceae bacterium]